MENVDSDRVCVRLGATSESLSAGFSVQFMPCMHISVYLCLSALSDSIWWLCGLYEVTMPAVLTLCNI